MRIKHIVGSTLAVLAIAGCNSDKAPELINSSSPSESNADSVSQCVARGVAYFKEIGSYPTLTSAPNVGHAAEDVALERCNRTLTAF